MGFYDDATPTSRVQTIAASALFYAPMYRDGSNLQVPHQLGNTGKLPSGYVKFAAGDPDNGCVLPNGRYRVRSQVACHDGIQTWGPL